MFFAVVIHEWAEPYSSEHVECQIYSSEHTRHKDRVRLEVRPECDSKPQEHIGEASYGRVGEDVREEGGGFHSVFLIFSGKEKLFLQNFQYSLIDSNLKIDFWVQSLPLVRRALFHLCFEK